MCRWCAASHARWAKILVTAHSMEISHVWRVLSLHPMKSLQDFLLPTEIIETRRRRLKGLEGALRLAWQQEVAACCHDAAVLVFE